MLGSTLTTASGTELQKPEAEERCALPAVWYSLVYGNETHFFPGLSFLVFDISSNMKTKDTTEAFLERAKLTMLFII